MPLSQVISLTSDFFVIEPIEILLIVSLPFLLNNSCIANTRQTLKDLGVF